MDWTFADDRPIYTQLVEQMEQAVVNGLFAPGERLPGVRELAADAGVNPNTMQRALAELETRGLVHAQRTSGRFVTDDAALLDGLRKRLAGALADGFVQRMTGLGCTDDEAIGYVRASQQKREGTDGDAALPAGPGKGGTSE